MDTKARPASGRRWVAMYLGAALAVVMSTGWALSSCTGSGGHSDQDACRKLCECFGNTGSSSGSLDSCVGRCTGPASSSSGFSVPMASQACVDCISEATCLALAGGSSSSGSGSFACEMQCFPASSSSSP